MTRVSLSDPRNDVEAIIARDIVRKAIWLAPVAVVVSALLGGVPGAVGASLACLLVVVNFFVGAVALSWAARISPDTLLGVALFSYLFRMALIVGSGFAVQAWGYPSVPAFVVTVLVLHLVLLTWETKSVMDSLRRDQTNVENR